MKEIRLLIAKTTIYVEIWNKSYVHNTNGTTNYNTLTYTSTNCDLLFNNLCIYIAKYKTANRKTKKTTSLEIKRIISIQFTSNLVAFIL